MTKSPTTDAIIAADWHKLEDDYVPASAYWRIATHAKEIEEQLTDMQAERDSLLATIAEMTKNTGRFYEN